MAPHLLILEINYIIINTIMKNRATDKRTQIYLTLDQFARAKNLARSRGVSLAAVIRDALEDYLKKSEEEFLAKDWEGDPINEIVGFFEGDKNLSQKHDFYLYGTKR